MSITYTGDPTRLQKGANDTAACLGELESQLRALSNVQDALQSAVQSQHTGQSIYNALGNAWHKGKTLAGTLQNIIDQLQKSGVHVDTQDLSGKAQIDAKQALIGGDGATVGSWAGASGKIDASSLA